MSKLLLVPKKKFASCTDHTDRRVNDCSNLRVGSWGLFKKEGPSNEKGIDQFKENSCGFSNFLPDVLPDTCQYVCCCSIRHFRSLGTSHDSKLDGQGPDKRLSRRYV